MTGNSRPSVLMNPAWRLFRWIASRADGGIPSARIHSVSGSAADSDSPAAKRCCRSRSDSTDRLQHPSCASCFGFEDGKVRDIGVPLDQGRNGTEAVECVAIQTPDVIRDVSIVSVDTDFAPLNTCYRVTGEMNLLHGSPRDPVQIAIRIKAVVYSVDIEIVDVEQQPAP